MTDKNWALNQLRHARNAYVVSLAGIRLIKSSALETLAGRGVVIKSTGVIFDPDPSDQQGKRFEVPFDQLIESRNNTPSDFEYDLETSYKFARRALVKESFEYAKAYASASGQLGSFTSAPWYDFFRLIRNALSHDFSFHFSQADHGRLPLSWGEKTIDGSMDGVQLTILDPHLAVAMAAELEAFVRAH
jgi:hypothetical protein